MELELFLKVNPEVVIAIFASIAVIVAILVIGKVVLAKKPKIKEVKKDDNSGDKEGSPKTDVHKSR